MERDRGKAPWDGTTTEVFAPDSDLIARSSHWPPTVVGEYQLRGQLACGRFTAVFSAVHPIIERRAVAKVVLPEYARDATAVGRMLRDAHCLSKIREPVAADLFGYGETSTGLTYQLMEELAGSTLADLVADKRVPRLDALSYIEQAIAALRVVHRHGIIHRDLSPRNLFVHRQGGKTSVRVLGFDLAKVTSGQLGQVRDLPGRFSLDYSAPEILRGQRVDESCDVYSLGVVAFHLLTGRLPHARGVVDNRAAPPAEAFWPDIPDQLGALIASMLSPRRDRRPRLDEVQRALRAILNEFGIRDSKPATRSRRRFPNGSTSVTALAVKPAVAGAPTTALGAGTVRTEGPGPRAIPALRDGGLQRWLAGPRGTIESALDEALNADELGVPDAAAPPSAPVGSSTSLPVTVLDSRRPRFTDAPSPAAATSSDASDPEPRERLDSSLPAPSDPLDQWPLLPLDLDSLPAQLEPAPASRVGPVAALLFALACLGGAGYLAYRLVSELGLPV